MRAFERFAYWQDAVCDSYVLLGCDTQRPRAFHGAIMGRRLPGISVSRVSGAQQIVRRRPQDIRRASDDDFLLSLQLETPGVISQGNRTAELNPGDMVLYDSSRQYQIDLGDGFDQLVLQIPRDALLARVPNAEDLTGLRISGSEGVGALARGSLNAFAAHVLSSGDQSNLMRDTLIDLVGLAVSANGAAPLSLSNAGQVTLLRAQQLIKTHARDAQFTRHSLAELMGVSVRRLNELFAAKDQTISNAIRDQRLEAAAADLRAPQMRGVSVTQIALRNGFASSSHFSSSFSQRFKCSPRAYRAANSGKD